MTISSSLNASVAGLNVNASKLATISDNIANAGTYGYKRADADFSALVVSSGNGGYTAGGVTATATREISAQGSIVSTEQALDLAVVGRGMLPEGLRALALAAILLPFHPCPSQAQRRWALPACAHHPAHTHADPARGCANVPAPHEGKQYAESGRTRTPASSRHGMHSTPDAGPPHGKIVGDVRLPSPHILWRW